MEYCSKSIASYQPEEMIFKVEEKQVLPIAKPTHH
jgi:hypothetical protein